MRSRDPGAVRDGLSNVLYWGWAQKPGRQRDRVGIFREGIQPNDPRLVRFMNFVHSMPRASQSAAEQLHALKQLKLPQFSQMSFTTKILMFLDPNRFAVLDLKIARVAKQCGFMQELKIYTGIPITSANAACYKRWASWCQGIAAKVNGMPGAPCRDLRAVDVERAVFSLADLGRTDDSHRLLTGPPGR